MADRADIPYKAEYAKSDRSSCKSCKKQIHKESLRLATLVQSVKFDGKMTLWFHFDCFWKRARPLHTSDIAGFDSLRWDDQQKIKEKLTGGTNDGGGSSGAAVGVSIPDGGSEAAGYQEYATEYAKSSVSKCRKCLEKIAKGEVRISRKEYESERAQLLGGVAAWYHVNCFVEDRDELGFNKSMSPSKIPGFLSLKAEDQQMVETHLGKGTAAGHVKKEKEKEKRKADDEPDKAGDVKKARKEMPRKDKPEKKRVKKEPADDEVDSSAASKSRLPEGIDISEKALKEQSEMLWGFRDKLQRSVSTVALAGLLDFNEQEVKKSESELLDRVADGMAFGALERCPECNEGQLVYQSDSYHCQGHLSGWTKCPYTTRTPKRRPFYIPAEYHDVPFLKKYKYKKRDRIFPADAPQPASSVDSKEPLRNLSLVIFGDTTRPRKEIKEIVEKFGGTVAAKVTGETDVLITTPVEVTNDSKKLKDAKKHGVFVVAESFADAVRHESAADAVKAHRLTDWGGDPAEKLSAKVARCGATKNAGSLGRSSKSEELYTKGLSKKVKVTVKGGAGIDPDSGLAEIAHLAQLNGDPLNAVLCMVDVSSGTNSYYKLQALEADDGKKWWVFRAWGRLGTVIGGNKLQACHSLSEAVDTFKEIYYEKTGNNWNSRRDFVKHPNRFYPIEIDYGQEIDSLKVAEAGAGLHSKLHVSVQRLMKMIFDIESMKAAMLEFEIDVKKVPLGKLTKKQIQSAYSVLKEIQELVDKKGSASQLLDASNRFYTLIPHDFGMKSPPVINTADLIQAKREMLDNLLEIEVAYNLLKSGHAEGKDVLDAHYDSLNADVAVMDRDCEEYRHLMDYICNTHAATHSTYTLDVEEVYTVDRRGEQARYKPFRDLHNRKLLWHGSRLTNMAGILSHGLKIAPPEAPVTGYMFGKGLYFADMVSKSANYCYATRSNPYGLLLLCEVALGNMHLLTAASNVTSLPKGKHSVKGCGMTGPDPKGSIVMKDGLEIPAGHGIKTDTASSSLLYNEFIVYDVAQVNIKYLMKVKFNWK